MQNINTAAASTSPPSPYVDTGLQRSASTPGERTMRRMRTFNPSGTTADGQATVEERIVSPISTDAEWTIFGELMRATESSYHASVRSRRRIPQRLFGSPSQSYSTETNLDVYNADILTPILDRSSDSQTLIPLSQQPLSPPDVGNLAHESNVAPTRALGADGSAIKIFWSSLTRFIVGRVAKDVAKCVIAYYIASLFTFVPRLSDLVSSIVPRNSGMGPSPSAHMVATIAVYFNPAKTAGAMVEADVFCIAAALFSSVVCLCAMENFWLLEVHRGLEWLAASWVLLWIAIAMSVIAWTKMWMNKPSFNTACSMAVVIISVVIVKEGGFQTLLHVLFVVLLGSSISNLVCFLIWPASAVTRLQTNMSNSMKSFSNLLELIAVSFVTGSENRPSDESLAEAIKTHQTIFTKLKPGLAEARSEWLDPRIADPVDYETAIDSLTRLAQHMTGLRDGTKLQNDLVERLKEEITVTSPEKTASKMTTTVLEVIETDLGEALEGLVDSCRTAFEGATTAFGPKSSEDQGDTFNALEEQIRQAATDFDRLSNLALLDLYRNNRGSEYSLSSGETMRNETVFHIYFFIFTLQEFASETVTLLEAMRPIWALERRLSRTKILGSASLGYIFHGTLARLRRRNPASVDRQVIGKQIRKRISIAGLLPNGSSAATPTFPEVRPHAPNTLQTPARASLSLPGKLRQTLWIIGVRMRHPDVKYAAKTGMAACMLAAPAFFDRTRPLFVNFRGEWAIVSFFVVMGPTIGATNLLGLQRILGTMLGALVAAVVFSLFQENAFVLSLCGALFSVPCFYIIVARPKDATSSRFVLLTYNLTCLYAYNLRTRDVPVDSIAVKRSVAVIIGVAWAFVVSRWWWPLEARRELGVALSEFCQQMGWLYSRLVQSYSIPPSALSRQIIAGDDSTELSPFLGVDALTEQYTDDFASLELHLQVRLIELQTLLSQTEHEPRLKGPFPVKLYRTMLTSLQVVLDKLHSMRCVTTREEWFTVVHHDCIMPVQRERREMVGNVILYFSTLSAAFRLKAPLPPYLPPAEQSRLRLIEAIRAIDAARDLKDSRHLLYYAYASAMHGVIQELERLGRTLQDAFGVIGDSRDRFEALFDNARLEAALQS